MQNVWCPKELLQNMEIKHRHNAINIEEFGNIQYTTDKTSRGVDNDVVGWEGISKMQQRLHPGGRTTLNDTFRMRQAGSRDR